ncbi:hypothetical protein [Hellea balneolensis]|uniref:hypothetical protein n=1 Tax=Hellea balneolensis TaxID=287478 RepID=UPI0003FF609D|nr:hypothetical protein [Hellea balneolensis]
MKEIIALKLDEKTVRESDNTKWRLLPLLLAFFGACWISYELITVTALEPQATNAKFLGIAILFGTIWGGKLLWSQSRLLDRQLRDGVTIYELTPDGITNHRGETQRWTGLKKIYFKDDRVHFSYMTFNRSAAFSMVSTGINPADFYEACEFIKHHAPKTATHKFKLDKIPRR